MKTPNVKHFKRKFIKSILWYIVLKLYRLLQLIISIIFFPLAYPYRHKAYDYVKKNGVKGWHILQLINHFFTKDDDKHDYYAGPYWYMKELKDKTFKEYWDDENYDPIVRTFKQKLIYFYIAYNWCGLRNYMWNLNRIMFYEGRAIGYYDLDGDRIFESINTMNVQVDKKIMPQLKFIDETGMYRDNQGSSVLYPNQGFDVGQCTLEGAKLLFFQTPKTKKDDIVFAYRYVKVFKFKLIKRFVALSFFTGWDVGDGEPTWHSKCIFTKFSDFNLKNYDKYLSEYY